MRVVLQSLGNGATEVAEVPVPVVRRGTVLIANEASLISAGTERMLVEFGRASLLDKARQQPEKVRQVFDKILTDGLATTLEAVRSKLDEPITLGYSACGRVLAVGEGVSGFARGDRVVSNGSHAEVVCVAKHLCAKVPDGVSAESAAFTVVASIGLQGVRLASPTLGETFVVTGLGLIGLLTVQLLRASGCEVIGLDVSAERLELGRRFGAAVVNVAETDPVDAVLALTGGRGADGVLITASTKSSEPVHQAAQMSRKRGRIVLVGVTGLELSRADFYEKELTFQVSCSYGPGRYDPTYEERGEDYPLGYVRWTEQRNFEAVLAMLATKRLDVEPLVSHSYDIADAARAYEELSGSTPALGLVLRYPAADRFSTDASAAQRERTRPFVSGPAPSAHRQDTPVIAFLGAGNFASRMLIPAFAATKARMKWVASSGGVSAARVARAHGIEFATTDVDAVFEDPEVNTIVIATRHDTHASYACRALEAGKHVFVEKPLALTEAELDAVEAAYREAASRPGGAPQLMVGFNRRFAPLVVRMRDALRGVSGPKAVVITVNAGAIPREHWTQQRDVGGGRIVGEACHFIDLARHLAGSPIVDGHASYAEARGAQQTDDVAILSLKFEDGSVASIQYLANGHRSYPKERIEVFGGGRVLVLDNFRSLRGFGGPRLGRELTLRQDKGHGACVAAWVERIASGGGLRLEPELFEASRWAAALAVRAGDDGRAHVGSSTSAAGG
jgi:predicted dehydrogenase/threonine dehydrogenase-like Zn-dependent dehydrogenase